jgi:AraC-like DNA-binding protein
MSALTAISLVGAGFGAWLGLPLLWSTGASARTGRLLGGLLTISAVVTAVVVDHANYLRPTRWLEPVEYSLTLVVGPVLLFYVRSALERPLAWRDAVHGLPLLGYLGHLAMVPALWAWPPVSIRQILVVQVGYTIAAGWTYLGVGRGSSRRAVQPRWPAVVLIGFAVVHVGQLVRLTGSGDVAREAVPLAMTATFLLFGAAGFHRALVPLAPSTAGGGGGSYARSALRPELVQPHLDSLARLMETGRVFTDRELTLAAVAAQIGVPPYQVSQLLNQYLERTFTDWVNDYRVAEVKRQLLDPDNDRFTIEAVASTAGFRSRAGFYKVFRRATGLTPSEFRRRGRLDSST